MFLSGIPMRFTPGSFTKIPVDTILAYTVEITGMEGAAIKGNLYTQDYRAMAEHIERTALPAASVTVQFEGQSEPMEFRYAYYHEHKLSFTPNLAKPRNSGWSRLFPGLLRGILASEQEYRHNFIPGVV